MDPRLRILLHGIPQSQHEGGNSSYLGVSADFVANNG